MALHVGMQRYVSPLPSDLSRTLRGALCRDRTAKSNAKLTCKQRLTRRLLGLLGDAARFIQVVLAKVLREEERA